MKIVNETRYETAPLRELARRVAAEELDKEKSRRMTVHFQEAVRGVSKDGALGRCALGGNNPRIFLPKDPARLRPNVLASTLAHEFAHARGMTHAEMRGDPRYSWRSTTGKTWEHVVEWRGYLVGLTFSVRPARPATRPSHEAKLEQALVRMQAWERRRKRAETGIKAWRRRVRYYERKIAAKTAPKGGAA